MAGVSCLAGAAIAQDANEMIDFGDDTSQWANDGECDDWRFQGDGMATFLDEESVGHDATDCRAGYEAGALTIRTEPYDPDEAIDAMVADVVEVSSYERAMLPYRLVAEPNAEAMATIDFGDDSGAYPEDGECDDPRFEGPGASGFGDNYDAHGDATDCRTMYEAGNVRHATFGFAPYQERPRPGLIDFGDDSSYAANDEQCDDPRFVGGRMALYLSAVDIRSDASDCRALYLRGQITVR
ncbi:hypothetical protein [Sphingomicrobium sediminis]|uniref:Uncharacterized protein n=1 Tax=Sphingomicrobium sediminis TaxID=2950949 RepID=A0A9X2EG01_9SPHN|nr:hypothetical protein [Sphingomicrobium sediminis]MCM8556807.1 hypothetical protein [Sphingomicrobium sediminis]